MRLGTVLAILLVSGTSLLGQELSSEGEPKLQHKFFDRTNIALIAGMTLAETLDITSTFHFRDAHPTTAHEAILGDFVDNRPAFVAYSYATVVLNVGAAWMLHRAGHHRLERASSIVHIGLTAPLAINNYAWVGHTSSQAAAQPQLSSRPR
ncbi:MAG TPA: hypothetical protein VFA76_11705 [Terriglobales bacterium]|nr:hypothetical protein [Terriglobales bacterium]